MRNLASIPRELERSGIREIMELAEGMDDVIHLEAGDPKFDTPAHIVEAAAEAARQGYTHYTPNAGFISLREAIVEKL